MKLYILYVLITAIAMLAHWGARTTQETEQQSV